MIITKTPFRMSFFGGGTDVQSYFKEYGGSVLSTTFDKYCYVNVRHLPLSFLIKRKFLIRNWKESGRWMKFFIRQFGMP